MIAIALSFTAIVAAAAAAEKLNARFTATRQDVRATQAGPAPE